MIKSSKCFSTHTTIFLSSTFLDMRAERDLMRHYVDTTDEIDYAKCLQYAGLALNRETWQLVRIENVTPLQEAIRKAILSE